MAHCMCKTHTAISPVMTDKVIHKLSEFLIGLMARNTPASPNEKTASVMTIYAIFGYQSTSNTRIRLISRSKEASAIQNTPKAVFVIIMAGL